MARKKILVIGANGFTGRRIQDDLSRNLSYQTTGCSLHDDIRPHSGDYRFIRTDICNRQAVEKLFQEVQPDVVINTSALSVPDYCETHHAEADAVNITAVEHLAECCKAEGSCFIHLSTDFVFSGNTNRPYTEEDNKKLPCLLLWHITLYPPSVDVHILTYQADISTFLSPKRQPHTVQITIKNHQTKTIRTHFRNRYLETKVVSLQRIDSNTTPTPPSILNRFKQTPYLTFFTLPSIIKLPCACTQMLANNRNTAFIAVLQFIVLY